LRPHGSCYSLFLEQEKISGAELARAGLAIRLPADSRSELVLFEQIGQPGIPGSKP
jgi:hypothetical protein